MEPTAFLCLLVPFAAVEVYNIPSGLSDGLLNYPVSRRFHPISYCAMPSLTVMGSTVQGCYCDESPGTTIWIL